MGKIRYTDNNYPIYFDNPTQIIGWVPYQFSNVKMILHYDMVYDILIRSGLSPEEAYSFFSVEDKRQGCVEDKGF